MNDRVQLSAIFPIHFRPSQTTAWHLHTIVRKRHYHKQSATCTDYDVFKTCNAFLPIELLTQISLTSFKALR